MPGHEADIVAYQLKNMFEKFSLPAHPSFFAGIPSEALAALLMANRRSELIQLAIDGFLSFVVASDKDSVRMSRTYRSRFLRNLVIEMVVEKRAFSEAELVKLASDLSKEYLYGLDPISFIKSFVDAGLLYFESDRAHLTLPFIEAYFLADEMSKNPDLATRYFGNFDDEIDMMAFDLYCEIGVSADCISAVEARLVRALASVEGVGEKHILLQEVVQPSMMISPSRLSSLSRRVAEARSVVVEGESERSEKAKILDVVERVNEEIVERERSGSAEGKDYAQFHDSILELLYSWTLAIVLLGSGAEAINGAARQELCRLIIVGAETIMEVMTRHVMSVNFTEIKSQIITDRHFREMLGAGEEDDEFVSIVGGLVDLVEYVSYAQSLEKVFDYLPDKAKHRIVGNSVVGAEVVSPMQKLIKSMWMANIDSRSARSELLGLIGQLPNVQFLRACMTSILITRVKWKISDKVTRMALLDAAEMAIRPFNPHMDKGEIMRFVERNPLTVKSMREELEGETEE